MTALQISSSIPPPHRNTTTESFLRLVYEVRKTKPRLKLPFTCYIYCTKSGRKNLLGTVYGTGSVIGEFTCDRIEGEVIYCWHISDFKRYDEPRPLSDFFTMKKCHSCEVSGYESSACIHDNDCYIPEPVKRPPQSYCLVAKNYMINNHTEKNHE